MVEELRAGLVAHTHLTLDQIKSRLTEVGVDVTKIFTTEESELELCEYRTSILAGSALTQDQLKSRLIELGADVSRLFPG